MRLRMISEVFSGKLTSRYLSCLRVLTSNFLVVFFITRYGNGVGLIINLGLLVVSKYMGKKFEELQVTGRKVGEEIETRVGGMDDVDHPDEGSDDEDSKCGLEEEGQSHHEDEDGSDEEENV